MQLRFSQDIESLLKQLSEEPLTIASILDETSERGFCLVIGLFVIPFLFPMPPGLTGIPGTGCIVLGMQMACGSRSPWLPKQVAQFQFPKAIARARIVEKCPTSDANSRENHAPSAQSNCIKSSYLAV